MTEHAEVLSTVANGVASIVLNRPERRNAITGPLGDRLAAAFAEASARDDVGAVLFHGAGGSFCSGLDLKEYNADPPPAWMATARDSLVAAHRAIFDCPVPVVVALERFAINGGAAFALAADLLVVGRDAYLQVGEIRQGMAAPMNLAWLLARHPASVAEQIALTGRRFVGPDLHRMGVALDVVDDDRVLESARALAVEVASYPTEQARAIKATIRDLAPATDLGDTGAWFDRANAGSPLPVGSAMRPRAVQ